MARLRPSSPKGLLDELADLAAPFADQADHDGVAGGFLGQHRQQHRLADARAGEDAQALAAAGGGEDVHRPHAQVEALADPAAGVGGRGRGLQGVGDVALRQRAQAVDGLAEGVDDAAQPGLGRTHHGALGHDLDLGAGSHALDGAERHQQGAGFAEADHLGRQGRKVQALDLDPRADGQTGQPAARLDQEAVHGGDATEDGQRIDTFDGGDQATQAQLPTARRLSFGPRALMGSEVGRHG
jgi:hypothetical protein